MIQKIITTLALSLSLLFTVFGCGKIDSAMEGMKKTTQNMEKTSENMRLQAMSMSIESMFSERARAELYPVPVGVLPGASKFGLYANSQEMVELTQVWLSRIDKIERLTKFDEQGNEVPLTIEEKNADLLDRYHTFQALSAIAALAPQYKVEEMAAMHVQVPGSRYRQATLNFIMLRAYFLRAVMIGEAILSRDFDNVGDAQKAAEYQRQVDWIVGQPYVASLNIKTRGLSTGGNYSKIQNLEMKGDLETRNWLVEPWDQIITQLEQILRVTARGDTGDPARDLEIYQQELKAVEVLLAEAKEKAQKWKTALK